MAEPIRIFIVEDEHRIARFLQMELEHEGFQTATEENGRRAFERIIQEKYDLVLLDIMLPEMDGLTAAKAIRSLARPDGASIPIIAMTANAYEEDEEKSRNAGMNAHLSKPIDPQKLYESIARFLNKQPGGEANEKNK